MTRPGRTGWPTTTSPSSTSAGLGEYRLATAGASAKDRLRRGTMFAKYAPKVFAAAWLCFGAMPILFYLRSWPGGAQ